MKRLTKIKIALLIFILVGLCAGIWKSTAVILSLRSQVAFLQDRNDCLVFDYANDQRQIDELKFEITGLNQKIESLEIRAASDELFIHALESRVVAAEMEYQQALSYIGTAEYVLGNLGVEYYYVGRR
jgi:hypothetical protein